MKPKTRQERIEDLDLLRRTAEGDHAAFNILVERYQGTLFNFLCRMVGDSETAEDILQETFIRIYETRERVIEKFSAWIFTIASNLARDELRRRKRKRLTSLEEVGGNMKLNSLSSTSHWNPPEPDQVVANGELRSRIEDAIGKLEYKYREVVLLRDIEGRTYEEISEILGMRLGTVKSRLNRARLKLQEELRPFLNGRMAKNE
jgi:RNA polymerase sigma-70 factor (ECF subfamily)